MNIKRVAEEHGDEKEIEQSKKDLKSGKQKLYSEKEFKILVLG